MATDVRKYSLVVSDLDTLNNKQTAFSSTNDAVTGWKMYGVKNDSAELSKLLALDKAARVTTFEATGAVTITSGTMTIDSLSLSTANAQQVMYGDFSQASTFKFDGTNLRVGSTTAPDYKVDIESTSQDQLRIINTNADANGALFVLEKTSASPADADVLGEQIFRGTNDDPSVPEVDYVKIQGISTDVSANNAVGKYLIQTQINGTMTDTLTLLGGNCNIANGVRTESPEHGPAYLSFNYGEDTPEHTNGIGSYDHTGGDEEQIFTKTSGDDFTQSDADNNNWILLTGENFGTFFEIKTYIDSSKVTVDGFGLNNDFSSQTFQIYKHPVFVTGDKNVTEISTGATGKFEVYSYSFTGDHVTEIKNNSAADNAEALRINVNGNGYNLNDGIHIQYNTGDIQVNDLVHAMHIQIDETGAESAASSTDIQCIRLETTDFTPADKCGICVGPGFDNVIRLTGASPEDPDYGYTIHSSVVVDRVNSTSPSGDDSFVNGDDDVQLFPSNNDFILIGSDSTFEIISVTLNTNGSQDSNLEFYYSKQSGPWTQFFPTDGTNGFTNSGNITFSSPAGWEKDTTGAVSGDVDNAYYIKIERTRLGVYTYPVEDFFKIYADKDLGMKIRGDGSIQPPLLADASAANDSIYYSSTQSKLVYKTSGGVVKDLHT